MMKTGDLVRVKSLGLTEELYGVTTEMQLALEKHYVGTVIDVSEDILEGTRIEVMIHDRGWCFAPEGLVAEHGQD